MVFTPGLRLTDRYTLVARIGQGGMSEVWRADDELLSRPVAVKALASPLAVDPALRAATWREARAAARLTHPQVTQVYDYGEAHISGGEPVPYLVMELVEGQNLAERLAAGPLPWAGATRVAAQVAAALAAAHALGVVHRDVKPGNVMLTPNGAKVLDFGIAALSGARPEHDGGLLIGTPAYAAPERLGHREPDPAADVYSLGALFYEALTGRPPLAITTWEQAAAAHGSGTTPATLDVPGLPADVAAVCLACLSRDPAGRPGAGEVAARLAAVATVAGGVGLGASAPGASAARVGHPPTLIDRSLAGTASPGSPATARPSTPNWVAAPGRPVGPAGAAPSRISASAAVVRRDPAPALGSDLDGPDADTTRPPRSNLTIVGVAGAIIAAGLTLALAASALKPDTGSTSAASSPSVTVDNPAPGANQPTTPARPRPTTADGVVEEFGLILTEAAAAGQLDEEVATDLRDKLDDVRKQLGERKEKNLRQKVEDLRDEVQQRLQDGQIQTATAEQLLSVLDALGTGGRDQGAGEN